MNELVITNEKGQSVTTSLLVAQKFGKNHADVLRAIRNLECSDLFRVSNFAELFISRELPNGGSKDELYYQITKDGFSFLVMGFTGEKAAQFKELFIGEFNKREAMLNSPDYIMHRALQIANERLELQQRQLQDAAPKIQYYDTVLQSIGTYTTNEIAHELGMSAVKLNRLLHQLMVQYKQGGRWLLYSKHVNKGLEDYKTIHFTRNDGRPDTNTMMIWTEKGRKFIHDLINEQNKAA